MRCKQCDYPLWNLTARSCPECGAPFAPSGYEFNRGSVQFRCPHCEQSYYGTTPQGHLDPPAFGCVGCGRHIHMDEMVLLPAEGVSEQQTRVDVNPWLDRENQNWFLAWVKTIGRGMILPSPLIKATPTGSSNGQAWLFCVLTLTFYYVVGALGYALLFGAMFAWIGMNPPGGGGPSPMQMFGAMMGTCAGLLLAMLLLTFAVLGVWGLVTHAVLRARGGEPAGGIGRTYQALCYSCGTNAVTAIPCINQNFFWMGWIWWVVCAIFMVKDGQRVSGGRATLAVLPVPIAVALVLVGMIVAYVLFIQAMMAQASAAATAATAATGQSGTIAASVWDYAELHDGQGPAHAIQLVATGQIQPRDLTVPQSLTRLQDIPVADTTLDQFEGLGPAEQQLMAQALAGAQPVDVTAHRLGDYVFVHHGLDFNNIDGRLWAVILWPDPDAGNNPPLPNEEITVGTMDGGFQSLSVRQFQERLNDQNDLRQQLGLPLLPHPSKVTHDNPARAGDEEADGDQ